MRPQAAAIKALLDEPGLHIMPGCGDGMGARLIEEAGFRTGFVSGSSIAAMRLAMPDMDLLTFPEMADAVETVIAAAPNVLWLADGDTGYGNALAVQKTIRAYARRGAAAVLIEDKAWPRPLGHGGAKLVIERDAAILRCRAAVEACREEGILLLARTDAAPHAGSTRL
jgi:2-methylisocitrate lyase-like PEP mutase family enzyme